LVKARREETAALEGVVEAALPVPVPVLLVPVPVPVKEPLPKTDVEEVTASVLVVLKKFG
jgi:hypothetical protein